MSKDLTDALRQAMGQTHFEAGSSYQPRQLPVPPSPAPIPPRSGVSPSALPTSEGGTGDLLEASESDRSYFQEYTLVSSDGYFTLVVKKPVKSIRFTTGDSLRLKVPL